MTRLGKCRAIRLAGALATTLGALALVSLVGLAHAQTGTVPAPGSPAPSKNPACAWPGTDKAKIYAFLDNLCYQTLGWKRDKEVRNTGPHLSDDLDFGTHPSVRIYYSPDLWKWMEAGRKGKLAGHVMIVKEQYAPPAQQYAGMTDKQLFANLCEWTAMVRAPNVTADGWYWADHGNPQSPASWGCQDTPPVTQPFAARVESQLNYPNSSFGQYCTNCHASAASDLTYSSPRNVNGSPITYLVLGSRPPSAPPTSSPRPPQAMMMAVRSAHPGIHELVRQHREIPPQGMRAPLPGPSSDFLTLYPVTWPVPTKDEIENHTAMPPETFDHVPMPARPDKAVQFTTSDQCLGCHDPAASTDWRPPMLVRDTELNKDINVAPYGEWRASMMGLAGRDPIFYAQLESEDALHPGISAETQDTCLSCHGVMGQRQYVHDHKGKLFSRAQVDAYSTDVDGNMKAPDKYGALAREGISCDLCHHISPKGLGTPATYTGRFDLIPSTEVEGPFEHAVLRKPMQNALGITPQYGKTIKSAALCGSCHTIVLPVFDGSKPVYEPGTTIQKTFYEQATYLEWRNSVYQDEIQPVPATARSCQSCHMPSTYKGLALETAIAYIETGNFPDVDERLPANEITPQPRADFARHMLSGINLFGLEFFKQFPLILGIRTTDPMLGDGEAQEGLKTSIQSDQMLATQETATVAVVPQGASAQGIDAQVQVTNLAGHKFPSGVGFRRAFVDFQVLDAGGKVLWESGKTDALGVLLGSDGKPLKTEFFGPDQQQWQPPYAKIASEDQVQIYQELVRDPKGLLTTSFLALDQEVKDNRLLPKGWSRTGPDAAITKPCAWDAESKKCEFLDQPGYNDGGGYDRVSYEVACSKALAGAAEVKATLYYQAIPPAYLKQRFADAGGWDTKRLYYFGSKLSTEDGASEISDWKVLIASATASLPQGACKQ